MALGFLKTVALGPASLLRKTGVGKVLGKIGETAAPFVGMIPGVGTLAATGLGAGSAYLQGKGLGGIAAGGLKGAAGGLAGKALGGIGGVRKLGSLLGGGGGGGIGGTGIGLGDVLKLGLGGAGVLSAAKQQGRANQVLQEQLAEQRALAGQRGRLRDQFTQRLQGLPSQREDLGSLFASANPFARSIPRPLTGIPTPNVPGLGVPQQPGELPLPLRRRLLTAGRGGTGRAAGGEGAGQRFIPRELL